MFVRERETEKWWSPTFSQQFESQKNLLRFPNCAEFLRPVKSDKCKQMSQENILRRMEKGKRWKALLYHGQLRLSTCFLYVKCEQIPFKWNAKKAWWLKSNQNTAFRSWNFQSDNYNIM